MTGRFLTMKKEPGEDKNNFYRSNIRGRLNRRTFLEWGIRLKLYFYNPTILLIKEDSTDLKVECDICGTQKSLSLIANECEAIRGKS